MQNYKTTLCGLAGAVALAWQPYLNMGRAPTASELLLAAIVAALGWFSADGGKE